MPAGSDAAAATQLRAQEGPKHKHTRVHMWLGGGEMAFVTETVNILDGNCINPCDLLILKSKCSVVVVTQAAPGRRTAG